MRADGNYTEDEIAKVKDFLKRGDRSSLVRMTLTEAQKVLCISKSTMNRRLNSAAWKRRGLRRIVESSKSVFVDRQVVLEIAEGKR